MRLGVPFLTQKIVTGLQHYLTDQTSWGRPEDGMDNVRIEIESSAREIEITTTEGEQRRRFLIRVVEAT